MAQERRESLVGGDPRDMQEGIEGRYPATPPPPSPPPPLLRTTSYHWRVHTPSVGEGGVHSWGAPQWVLRDGAVVGGGQCMRGGGHS